MTRSSTTQSIGWASPPVENGRGLIAALGDHGVVAELAHHVFEQTPLHRIVVDDENTL